MNQRLLNASAGTIMLCSIVATGVYVRTELRRGNRPAVAPVTNTTRFVPDAARERAIGTRVGPADAPVTLVEFTDLQCPACRSMESSIQQLRERWPQQVSIVYRHFPLESIHPQARAAAEAWECAGMQGRFVDFSRTVYSTQDSLGRVAWTELARRANVGDTAAFASCVASGRFSERVRNDAGAAERLGFIGTPTIIIGDSAYAGAPLLKLDSIVRVAAARAGAALR